MDIKMNPVRGFFVGLLATILGFFMGYLFLLYDISILFAMVAVLLALSLAGMIIFKE